MNWTTSKEDSVLVDKIVDRAIDMLAGPVNRSELYMDIIATHNNGTKLDLQKFLDAPSLDFAHDLLGIRRHINRKTGKLMDCFLPRCAR